MVSEYMVSELPKTMYHNPLSRNSCSAGHAGVWFSTKKYFNTYRKGYFRKMNFNLIYLIAGLCGVLILFILILFITDTIYYTIYSIYWPRQRSFLYTRVLYY